MLAHAVAGLPNEACGLFAGPLGTTDVDVFYPMTNTANSSQIYELDGSEMLDAEAAADGSGRQVLGVMHSHTHTTAYPSPTDVSFSRLDSTCRVPPDVTTTSDRSDR